MKNSTRETIQLNIAMPEGLEEELYKKCRSHKHTREVTVRYTGILSALFILCVMGIFGPLRTRWIEKAKGCADTQTGETIHTATLAAMMDPEIVNDSETPQAMRYDTADIYQNSGSFANDAAGIEVAHPIVTDRKLIRNIHLDVETQDFQNLIATVTERVKGLGGYIENSNIYNGSNYSGEAMRNATMTLRIPSTQADAFLNEVANQSNITMQTENVTDVTLEYVDMECHKRMLQAELDNMMELLEETTRLDDMITIENRISELRYQIESMESQLRTFDNKVDYTTVQLQVTEVQELTEIIDPEPKQDRTTWNRITEGFTENLNHVHAVFAELLVWFASHLPSLLAGTSIILAGIHIVKRVIRRRNQA